MRTKQVHTGAMVAHLWATRAQESARTRTGSFYFDKDTIYSYGAHFPIARHVERNDQRYTLVTTKTSSVATANHAYQVQMALRSHDVIMCRDLGVADTTSYHAKNVEDMQNMFNAMLLKADRARSNMATYVNKAGEYANNFQRYIDFFELTAKPLILPYDFRERAMETDAAVKARVKERDVQIITNTLDMLCYWKRGASALREHFKDVSDSPHYNMYKVPVALRVHEDGEQIETSHGAQIPIEHAYKVWQVVSRLREGKQTYTANGHTLHAGPFAVQSIDEHGTLRAGCHTIDYAAMLELATQMNWNVT